MSNGIGKNPLIDISKVYVQQVVEKKKDDTYLEPDMKKRQANNEKARKDMEKMGTSMKNPHFESVEKSGWDAIKACSDGYNAVYDKQEVEEVYKGKHGQTDKQYADSRSDAGKMVSGDSKMSGSKYAQGRRTGSDAGPQPAGGSKKPQSQGKMDSGTRTDLMYRKAALKKKAAGMKEEASMTTQELQLQKKKARIDRMIAQKRQQDLSKKTGGDAQPTKAMGEGMECVHNPKGKNCPVHGKEECPALTKEEASDAMKDRRMERGGVGGNTDYSRPPGKPNLAGKKKPKSGGPSALDFVKAQIRAKHGQGAIMDTKKK